VRYAFAKCLEENLSTNTVLLVGDLGAGVFDKFKHDYPNQFFNIGVAEQNMTSIAAGLALGGKKVFTYSIANFNTLKCVEQIRNDIAFHKLNVAIVSVGAGLSYGSLGFTHHATEDIAIMRAIPNIKVFSPCDGHETYLIAKTIIGTGIGSCYIRLGPSKKEGIHTEKTLKNFSIGKGLPIIEVENKDIALVCTGSIIQIGLEVAEFFDKKGIGVSVFSFHTIKPFDKGLVLKIMKEYKHIFSLEEHSIIGGLSSAIAESVIGEKDVEMSKMNSLALPSAFSDVAGDRNYLIDSFNLSKEKILRRIKKTLNE
tara:strand:+ start:1351 stop:2286 length:936 start_codon:yes stop_codon:yes gene_type:complete